MCGIEYQHFTSCIENVILQTADGAEYLPRLENAGRVYMSIRDLLEPGNADASDRAYCVESASVKWSSESIAVTCPLLKRSATKPQRHIFVAVLQIKTWIEASYLA